MQEMIDVYDKNRRIVGPPRPRKGEGSRLSMDEYALVVIALLENEEGKYLITQRSMDKAWGAGWWEVSGGGASQGESSRDAIDREVREETGVEIEKEKPVSIYCYVNQDQKHPEHPDNYFCDIYHFKFDFDLSDVKLQEEETIGGKLVRLDEMDAIAEKGEFLHYARIKEALAAEEVIKKMK